MADVEFKVPSIIDVMLGAEVIEDVMKDNRIKDDGVFLRESLFDWIVSGPVKTTIADFVGGYFFRHVTTPTTDSLLSKFWALEEVPERKKPTPEETQ